MATANEYLPVDRLDHVAHVDDLDLMNNTAFSYSLQRKQMIFRWLQHFSRLGSMIGQDEYKIIINVKFMIVDPIAQLVALLYNSTDVQSVTNVLTSAHLQQL